LGYLRPGSTLSDVTGSASVTAPINSCTIDPKNTKYYIIEQSPELHQGALVGYALVDNDPTTYPHTIGDDLTGHGDHITIKGEDVIIYPIGTTHYLFYSWNDNIDGDVGRVALTGSLTFEDDNLSNTIASGAVLIKGVPHQFLEWQENGKLYISNGRDLVEIDGQTGANGTADMTAFRLPVGWVMTTIFDAGDLIGICASYCPGSGVPTYATRTAVFFWDGVSSTKFVKKILLPDTKIVASIVVNGIPYLLTESSSL